jgi:ribosomal-protein-alanine N-acetyltransferase
VSAVLANRGAGIRPLTGADLDAVMEIEIRAYDFPWTQGIFRDCLRVKRRDDPGLWGDERGRG